MTNGEKIKEVFPDTKIITQYDNPFGDRFMVFTLNNEDMQVNINWWNAEYKEPTTKNDLGVDCISRQDVLSEIIRFSTEEGSSVECQQLYCDVNNMPSVTPIRPKGHWITRPHIYGVAFCSECDFELKINNTNYCPNCGADMREVEK